jgi:U3 small nucleolar RNA-associated protein 24
MGTAKKTRKFGAVKRMIGSRDTRLKKNQEKDIAKSKEASQSSQVVREIPQASSALFFQYNTALVPPYSVLIDVSEPNSTARTSAQASNLYEHD